MLGTGLQYGRVRGEDRFYIPVKAKKNQNHRQQQQQQKQEQQLNKTKKGEEKGKSPSSKSNVFGTCNGNNAKEHSSTKPVLALKPPSLSHSNLDRFLESTTPSVPAQYFSKTTMRGWRTCDVEYQPYFTLGDLWESFTEWSAYGAGVPFILDGSDCVVQYYVPYLSGIQLYGESTQATVKSRQAGEDSDVDYFRDSSSDGNSDHETEKSLKFSKKLRSRNLKGNETSYGISCLSISDENSTVEESIFSDDSDAGISRGELLFEFLERDTPYSRGPLADKISDLACRYPGLKTLRSCDLLPVSWVSVAWYPIYRIPTGPTLKDLDACFLTYHCLSTPMKGSGGSQAPIVVKPSEMDGIPRISLPIFGMASYKVKGLMWTENKASEYQRANSLMQAADRWLRLLRVNHPDFQFFASHGMYPR